MEVRDQDKKLGYNQPNSEPPPPPSSKLLRRRDEVGLDDTTQTLDHNHFNLQQQGRDPNPDPAPIANPSPIRYRECLKNHAAGMGGHVMDGCGEFMPGGEEETAEALKCAACDCHRNFHRKQIDGESQYHYPLHNYNPNINSSNRIRAHTISHLPPPTFHNHHHKYNPGLSSSNHLAGPPRPMMMVLGGGLPAESSSEDLNMFQSNVGGVGVQPMSKKRFRTKFSKDQKGKMLGFAEKLEWKIQKQDEQEVGQFCCEVGIKRLVFKVWMHNNKQAMKKQQQ